MTNETPIEIIKAKIEVIKARAEAIGSWLLAAAELLIAEQKEKQRKRTMDRQGKISNEEAKPKDKSK